MGKEGVLGVKYSNVGKEGGRGEKLANGRSTWRVSLWKEKRYVVGSGVGKKRALWRGVAWRRKEHMASSGVGMQGARGRA